MSRVDFYILNQQPAQECYRFACRVLEKAYQQGRKVYVYMDSDENARKMDELLWTFHDISFIPHALIHLEAVYEFNNAPIHIGVVQPGAKYHDILVNLSFDDISFYARFKRIIEFVPDEEPWRSQARKRYIFYRDNHCDIHNYQI